MKEQPLISAPYNRRFATFTAATSKSKSKSIDWGGLPRLLLYDLVIQSNTASKSQEFFMGSRAETFAI